MSNPKVFEFAKEIGLTPLALMDKIKEWQLPVKSHMAELEPEMLEAIRQKLQENGKAAPEKKPVAKKRATAPKAAAEKTSPAEKAKASAKKAAPVKAGTAKVAAEKVSVKTAAPTIVRRKAKVEETKPEEALVEEVVEPVIEAAPVAPVPEIEIAPVAPTVVEVKPVKVVAPVPAVEKPAAVAAVAPAPTVTPTAPAAPVAAAPVATAVPLEEVKKEDPKKPAPVVARKKEVAIGHSGVTSEVNPAVTARRNIVGRMDLSRVQAPPRPGGDRGGPRGAGGAGGQQTTGFGSRPKGNLRAGFIAAAPEPLPSGGGFDDELYKKKDEKRRQGKGGPTDGAATAKEGEQPPAFDAAEFRKREMVFQPKKKKGILTRPALQTVKTVAAAHKRIVQVEGTIKVVDLAKQMGIKGAELTKVLVKNGVMATPNTDLDFDTVSLIVSEFGWEAKNVQKTAKDVITETSFGDLDAVKVTRPPVVTIMGHVDHGKTSLLDAIRQANVAAGEAGGITQHIGAYQVSLEDGYKITFLDTPGHEAFTAMRARGANVTDIAIIVVAADDGVMPQTAEAISHAKAAGVPMIVAVNKIDKPGANPDKVKQQLTEYEVVPEEWGGTTIFCNVSALKKTGVPELLEQIKLVAEVGELKANPKRSALGTVIESRLEKGRGPVATILVQDGTIAIGQQIVAGVHTGRVKSLTTDRGERVKEAGPGMPVEILGLDGVPAAGDKFDIVEDDRAAEHVVQIRKDEADAAKRPTGKISLEEIFAKVKQGDVKELAVVLKADVAGSLEAIQGMFGKLSTPEVKVKIVHSQVGGITESDVLLAKTAKGLIIGFNVRPDGGAAQAARSHGIEIRSYSIVYELIDDMKKAMAGLLAPTVVEKVLGRAEVRNTFTVPKIGTIAGCFVSDGKIQRSSQARLIRDGKIVYEGKISSLKRFKDDAREVATGFECGIGIENFNDVKVGDVIEAFIKEEVARTLEGPEAQA